MASKSKAAKKPSAGPGAARKSQTAAPKGGVSPELLAFLKGLKKNNDRTWMEARREDYESARIEFSGFVRELLEGIVKFDPALRGVDVHDCIFRIHRDVRFSRDKSPYKPHFAAFLAKDGKKSKYPGYYIHIEPGGESMAAGGIYHPLPENLALIRAKAAVDGNALKKILASGDFKKRFKKGLEGDRLKTVPRMFAKDHPHGDLLCLKDFIVTAAIPDAVLSKDLLKESLSVFRAMLPLQKWLASAVS